MPHRRMRRRPIRRVCLDLAHRDPDMACPYCSDDHGVVLEVALRRHAQLAAEDAAGFGWS